MGEKLVVGPINKGLRTDRTPFVIDNDSFPTLINAYQWRGRIKRKRGTSLLCRLQRFFNSTNISYNSGSTTITLDGAGVGNILTGFSLQVNGNIIPGSVTLVASGGPTTFTDPTKDGFLTPTGTGGPNTIDYATGVITIPSQAGNTVTAIFLYFPDLPVMGLEELNLQASQFPGTLAFDTVYSYIIQQTAPFSAHDVSFYKNPPPDATNLPGYVPKTNPTPTTWNGQDYQQFWTVNYQNALWATNGITVPFNPSNIGMQFQKVNTSGGVGVDVVRINATTMTFNIDNCPLVIGDFVFANEFSASGGDANALTLNFQTGYVTNVVKVGITSTVTVVFPDANIAVDTYFGGLLQYLTNRSSKTIDCLRWFDGDPTNGSPTSPAFVQGNGWVNFAPPLSFLNYSINDTPARQYYLVGARVIQPFKDQLLFFGPVIQNSSGTIIYLQDTVVFSQNGTAFYTSSFTGDPRFAKTVFNPILVPVNQTATANAYWEDITGFGGFLAAGIDQPIISALPNEDVLIVGFTNYQTKIVGLGNSVLPFGFFAVNSELGTGSTFSANIMDKGIISRGQRGYIITSQTEARRIDLDIPDQFGQIKLFENGNERFCSQRDFQNEWIYFTYNSDQLAYLFPNQTLQFNYRDNSWAIFNESYTTYGKFIRFDGLTWATVGAVYPSWTAWNVPWNASQTQIFEPDVIGGNQQGFVLVRDDGTEEGKSLYIRSIVGSTITSPHHSLIDGDFIIISDTLGTISTIVNGAIFKVTQATENTFVLDPPIPSGFTYLGSGLITRMYVPFIQTKQFPLSWEIARKTRIGPQQYLLTRTDNSQITLLIFLSQDSSNPFNIGPIVPQSLSLNNSLIYSTILFTCPESTNLGLTPANINLQTPTAPTQAQIWHRINTSLIGDTVQIGFTMSEDQMRALDPTGVIFNITGASQTNPCVLNVVNDTEIGQLVKISGVVGMTELNFTIAQNNIYVITAVSPTTITIDVDATGFGLYISGGTISEVAPLNQFAEIELHGFILDVQPSQLLV